METVCHEKLSIHYQENLSFFQIYSEIRLMLMFQSWECSYIETNQFAFFLGNPQWGEIVPTNT